MLRGADGENINGPSLIRVPDWLPRPLGRYYLYFSHHAGSYIRLAFADSPGGPWTIYHPGTLRIEDTIAGSIPKGDGIPIRHIASPDVHVDDASREIRMYFHGPVLAGGDRDRAASYRQMTMVARSSDGIEFRAATELLGTSYFRVFPWGGMHYALAMQGRFYRSPDGLSGFVEGPTLFTPDMRHLALRVDGHTLFVVYTIVGENPERILLSRIDLTPDWTKWKESEPEVVLEPEREWEGAALPARPSRRGRARDPVRQLRDPALFEEEGRHYLLYSVAGERGLAIARIHGSWAASA